MSYLMIIFAVCAIVFLLPFFEISLVDPHVIAFHLNINVFLYCIAEV